ncbi:MAG: rRNA pseudouridine synthase [Nitrospinae bacterium]|nr:rRNA pseudouridine synthase [Nitrospinota bacterium]
MKRMEKIRLQKILAEAGIFSRRKGEDAIAQGRIKVNGETITEQGFKANPYEDSITCDGKLVKIQPKTYILMNKPAGIICTCKDDEGRTTVLDIIKHVDERLFPVGRLDYNTTGLLLLTNDGEFAQKMMHPSGGILKTYSARVRGVVTKRTIDKMLAGITVEGIKYRFQHVRVEKASENNSSLVIGLTEGKNRHIKILCQALGHPVSKLSRITYGPLKISNLQPGDYRHLSPKEIGALLHTSGKAPVAKTRSGVRRGRSR